MTDARGRATNVLKNFERFVKAQSKQEVRDDVRTCLSLCDTPDLRSMLPVGWSVRGMSGQNCKRCT